MAAVLIQLMSQHDEDDDYYLMYYSWRRLDLPAHRTVRRSVR